MLLKKLSLVPISTYNKTKMIAERILFSFKDKINIFSVRPATSMRVFTSNEIKMLQ